MLSKTALIFISVVAVIILGLLTCLTLLIIQHFSKKEVSKKLKLNTLSYFCIIIMGLSFVLNMGWIRLIFAIPILIHAIVFFVANNYYAKYSPISAKVKAINLFVYVTYLLAYALFPDGGDTEDSLRVFFGLIKNEGIYTACWGISKVLFITNVVFILLQFVSVAKYKYNNKTKQNSA